MTISWSASGASGDVTLDSYDAAAHVYLEQSVTHIEMSSIAPSRLGAVALIIPAGLSSNVSTTLSATDDWGMFAYTNSVTGADYLTEIDVGIWEQHLDDAAWELWVKAKRDLAAVSLSYGGSISACHGSCREGEVDLVPQELGRGFQVMLDVKRTLDPNNIMNPGKYLLDGAYAESGDDR